MLGGAVAAASMSSACAVLFTFAAPWGPSSFVTLSLACFARSVVFVLARFLPKKKDILLGVDGARGGVEGLTIAPASQRADGSSLRADAARRHCPLAGSLNAQTNRKCQLGFLHRQQMARVGGACPGY